MNSQQTNCNFTKLKTISLLYYIFASISMNNYLNMSLTISILVQLSSFSPQKYWLFLTHKHQYCLNAIQVKSC